MAGIGHGRVNYSEDLVLKLLVLSQYAYLLRIGLVYDVYLVYSVHPLYPLYDLIFGRLECRHAMSHRIWHGWWTSCGASTGTVTSGAAPS